MTPRQDTILAVMRQRGKVLVEDLADLLNTTPQTIRKDLRALEAAGHASRFHGGASLRAASEYLAYDLRRTLAAEAKSAIGSKVAEQLSQGATVFVNAGTTTEAAARALSGGKRLTLIADSVNIANITRQIPGVETIVTGGQVRAADGAVVGAAAVAFLEQFRADVALIGAAAIARDGTMMDFDLDEALVARAMIRNAAHTYILADESKFDRSAPVRIGGLTDASVLVTDRCENPALRALCADAGVRVLETMPSRQA
ncbi:MAG: DeoR/GlpR family DNA-binding transcription regulator [Pseudomonadota bacterium]